METAKQAFILFYGLFWAAVLAALSQYGPFHVRWMSQGKKLAIRNTARFLLGLMILNFGPLFWLLLLYKQDCVIPAGHSWQAILAAALAALSVFGFVNLGHALYGTSRFKDYMYTKDELENPKYSRLIDVDTPSWVLFLLAVVYFIMFVGLASFAARWA